MCAFILQILDEWFQARPLIFSVEQFLCGIFLQVLDEWFQARPLTYSVQEFLHEVKKWQSERYLNRNVWIRLQEYVGRELLQTIESTSVSF